MKIKRLILLPLLTLFANSLSSCALFCEVTWKNWDGSVLEYDENVFAGEVPSYDGITPKKPSTPEFDYEWVGWDKNENEKVWLLHNTFVAQFKEIRRSYKVKWVETEVGTLKEEDVLYGAIPEPWSPPYPSSVKYDYGFTGWDKDVVPVTGDVTYTTTFSKTIRSYEIKFVDYDGTLLKKETVKYNEMPTAPEEDPTRDYDDTTVYTFNGWDKDIVNAVADVTYKAVYSTRPREMLTISYCIDGVMQDPEPDVYPNSVKEFDPFTIPFTYTDDDFYDLDWYLTPDYKQDSIIINNEIPSVLTDLTVYGKRLQEHEFKIEYDLGEGGFLPQGHKYPETVTYSQVIDLDSCKKDIFYAPRLPAHMFDKWLDKEGNEIKTLSGVNSDIVLKATYKVEKFSIYFDWSDLTYDPIEVAYNSESYLEELTKDKYILYYPGRDFIGWRFEDENEIVSGPYLYNHDIALVPVFDPSL